MPRIARMEETHAYKAGFAAGQARIYGWMTVGALLPVAAAWILGIRTGPLSWTIAAIAAIPFVLFALADQRRNVHMHADFQERHGRNMRIATGLVQAGPFEISGEQQPTKSFPDVDAS